MSTKHHEVIVVGAGAAGLACARDLARRGLDVGLVEARERVGGRIFTLHEPGEAAPVEFGAEFVHGKSPVSMRVLNEHGLSVYDVNDSHKFLQVGRMRELDFWGRLQAIVKKMKKQEDVSVEQFLARQRITPLNRKLFASYVEGFHGADLSRLSVRALYEAESGGSEEGDARVLSGYDRLPLALLADSPGVHFYRGERLRAVEWAGDEIRLLSDGANEPGNFSCQRLVIALPLGVLREEGPSQIHFFPALPEEKTEALQAVETGHVQRMVFRFRSRFFEQKGRPVSFLHAGPDYFFPSWWTLAPLSTNYLVAWQGGPKAESMAGWGLDQKVQAAFATLAALTRFSVARIEKEMLACYTHDWANDPFSRGAYSYVRAGRVGAARRYGDPVKGKLFFAGEAAMMGEARGTVHGAMASGQKAAGQVWRSMVAEDHSLFAA